MISLLYGNKKAPSKRRGTSLLEIMISILILCVAALGAAGLISHGHRETSHDFRRGEALQILVDKMNFLSSLPYKTLVDAIGSSNTSSTIDAEFKGVGFGTVTVGQNKYDVTAILKKQSITFDNLMELDFPNKDYVYNQPNTWKFRSRDKESYDGKSTSSTYPHEVFDYVVVKITVNVTPIDGKTAKKEKTYSAITFVCNTE